MNYQMIVTNELRQRLAFAQTISIDLTEAPEIRELQASAAESNLHIDSLHAALKNLLDVYCPLSTPLAREPELNSAIELVIALVNGWEDDQCL